MGPVARCVVARRMFAHARTPRRALVRGRGRRPKPAPCARNAVGLVLGARARSISRGAQPISRGEEWFSRGAQTFFRGEKPISRGAQGLSRGEERICKGQEQPGDGGKRKATTEAPRHREEVHHGEHEGHGEEGERGGGGEDLRIVLGAGVCVRPRRALAKEDPSQWHAANRIASATRPPDLAIGTDLSYDRISRRYFV